jgi:hypothetical protein
VIASHKNLTELNIHLRDAAGLLGGTEFGGNYVWNYGVLLKNTFSNSLSYYCILASCCIGVYHL